jgi:hypothetical protein
VVWSAVCRMGTSPLRHIAAGQSCEHDWMTEHFLFVGICEGWSTICRRGTSPLRRIAAGQSCDHEWWLQAFSFTEVPIVVSIEYRLGASRSCKIFEGNRIGVHCGQPFLSLTGKRRSNSPDLHTQNPLCIRRKKYGNLVSGHGQPEQYTESCFAANASPKCTNILQNAQVHEYDRWNGQ